MNNFHFSRKKEQGVVLLTCLVFLLILLLMLRFTISSARVEEQKAAIDLDIVTARESAQAGLNYVEFYIRRQGQMFCQNQLNLSAAVCASNPWAYANLLFNRPDSVLSTINNSDTDMPTSVSISALFNNGIYTGEFLRANAPGCDPTWICVNWPNSARAVVGSATAQRGGGAANLNFITCPANACNTTVAEPPRFIIERLKPSELDPTGSGLADTASPAAKGVILRVTVVGFGAGPANSRNLSNVVLQNVYVIPNS